MDQLSPTQIRLSRCQCLSTYVGELTRASGDGVEPRSGGRVGALLRHHLQVSAFPGVVGAKGEMDVAISSSVLPSVLPSHSLSSSRPPPPPRRCDVTLAHRRRTQYPNQFECHNTASQPASFLPSSLHRVTCHHRRDKADLRSP